MRIVLMGMPGVGKGTQAVRLKERLGVVHVSTGDILREAVHSGSGLGRRARATMESGGLVPDDLMGEMIAERLGRADAAPGFVLDGFPRTATQVAILDQILQRLGVGLDAVCLLSADEGEIVRRLAGRRVCPRCSAVYHLESRPPVAPGVCDACGSALAQRPDDCEEVVRERLRVYRDQTEGVTATYAVRGLLRHVEASGDAGSVERSLWAEIGS